ncbi:CHAP domain-containing protein [Sulfuriflexus mobilis]|uniref:CHAP domain-containing protein n=1 Tax=Sulfuriflexus mobilis TaxID=1811807 RepID=UPI000F826F72|nr:CHAP domain-containing protein [Sulfuriflexus mobilis]
MKDINDRRAKTECVGHARDWLCRKRGLTFEDVNIAADIWDKINFYSRISDSTRIPLENLLNGSPHPPMVGDLVIYSEKYRGTGHVAVVVDINSYGDAVTVSEQNYINGIKPMGHKRRIPLMLIEKRYWLLDDYLIGLKRYK